MKKLSVEKFGDLEYLKARRKEEETNWKIREDLIFTPELNIKFRRLEGDFSNEEEEEVEVEEALNTFIAYKNNEEYCIAKSWVGAQLRLGDEEINFFIGNSKSFY